MSAHGVSADSSTVLLGQRPVILIHMRDEVFRREICPVSRQRGIGVKAAPIAGQLIGNDENERPYSVRADSQVENSDLLSTQLVGGLKTVEVINHRITSA